MTMAPLSYRGVLLAALLSLSSGCAPQEDTRFRPEDGPQVKEAEDQMERKAPPIFLYRPGAGLTIESAEGKWSVRL